MRLHNSTVEETTKGMREGIAIVLEQSDMWEYKDVGRGALNVAATHLRMIAARLDKLARAHSANAPLQRSGGDNLSQTPKPN